MTSEEIETITKVARALSCLPERSKQRYCFGPEFGGCGCLGCANLALRDAGLTYDDWRLYMGNKPPPYQEVRELHRKDYERIRAKHPDLGLPPSQEPIQPPHP